MEQAIVSMSAGMSIEGLIPLFYAQSPFIVERAYEQLKIDYGYQMTGGNFIGLGASAEIAVEGPTHCCPADVEALKLIPNMQIVVPGNVDEFETLLRSEYANGSPTYYRMTRYNNSYKTNIQFGKANVIKRGGKATVVVVGPMLELIMRAIGGEDVTILYYTTVMPFDYECLQNNLTNNRVMLCEPYYGGGLTTEIMSALAGEQIKMNFIGYPKEFVTNYGYVVENAKIYGLTEANIRNRIKELME
jgi:transketolase